MKPAGKPSLRGPFRPIATNVAGIQICEHLPLTARQADKYTIVRSMTHGAYAHEAALSLLRTGRPLSAAAPALSMGAVVQREFGARSELPAYVSLASARRAAALGLALNSAADAASDRETSDLETPVPIDWMQSEGRYGALAPISAPTSRRTSRHDDATTGSAIGPQQRGVLDRMRTARARKAFDIADEPRALRERYGRNGIGQSCLLARRLVESGVRFVSVDCGDCDHHANIFDGLANDYLPRLDRGYATLLADLDQRGLLDSTIVLLSGEFGRTPQINACNGRDHWPNAFSLLLAGGGIEGGRVWGSTDDGRNVRARQPGAIRRPGGHAVPQTRHRRRRGKRQPRPSDPRPAVGVCIAPQPFPGVWRFDVCPV